MAEVMVLAAFADALDAASEVLHQRIALLDHDGHEQKGPLRGAVARARAVHPQLGPRQAEVIDALEQAGTAGSNTGVISRLMGYDQPNVYLTLRGLVTLGFVEKDEATTPHTYKLTNLLSGDPPEE